MNKVSLHNVGRRFASVTAVQSVSLDVQEGEFVTLLGPSGCGKTTTLRMIAGLEHNTSGTIAINGRVVSGDDGKTFVPPDKRDLGMVFQSYAIWPHMTVFENVAYPLKVRGVAATALREGVHKALRTVEMDAYADRGATALSGGQQQRVAIARAIASEPQVLLLDEPLSNLDARLRLQMAEELRDLQQRLRVTSIYVTHDQEEAMALSDRIVLMKAGRVLQIAPPADIYERPDNADVARFFGSPNLLRGRVVQQVRVEGGHAVLVRGDGWQGLCDCAGNCPEGTDVTVMIRPENLQAIDQRAVEESRVQDIVFNGTVAHSSYRGARRQLTVDCGGQPIHAELPGSLALSQDTRLTLRASRAWAMPDIQESKEVQT